jgi:hypothetical protein
VSLRRPKQDEMTESWRLSLADALHVTHGRELTPPEFSLVFFDDVVWPATTVVGKGGADPGAELAALDPDELADFETSARELLPPDDLAAAETMPPGKAITGVPRPVARLLAALDRRFGAAAVVLLIWQFRQVHRYLRDHAVKAEVDARVRAAVTGECRVLCGHSLGSIVAFEFIRQNPGQRVELLLTVGSPLGLRLVRDRLADRDHGSGTAWGVPDNIGHWVNLRDLHDPVACAGDLHTWWPGVVDRHVTNGADAHCADRYLAHRYVGQAVLAAIPELAR